MPRDFLDNVWATVEWSEEDLVALPEIDPRLIAERVQVIIDVMAEGKRPKFCGDTGISAARLSHILSASRQTITPPDALRILRAYRISLDFIYGGDRNGLPLPLQNEIDARIKSGSWLIAAPQDDAKPDADKG